MKSWNTSTIPTGSEGMGMNNVVGCTFISDNTGSDDKNSPIIYVRNVAFLYRRSSGSPFAYTLKNRLSAVSHWNESHTRSTKIQGGYVDRGSIGDNRFFGIVIQYWASKATGTTGRTFSHRIKNLKFIVGNTQNPRTDPPSTSNLIVLESGTNKMGEDSRKIWTA